MIKKYFLHETSVVDEKCYIGENTKIWHFTHILSNCEIGNNCIIGQNAMIGPSVKIGKNCKIQNNVSVYRGITFEDGVFCGPSAVFTNVINPRAEVERKNEFKETLVKEGATIGANSTIICGITIGKYSMIGAGSTVTKNVPDYALVVGSPARQKAWVSRLGYKLDENLKCPESDELYSLKDNKLSKL